MYKPRKMLSRFLCLLLCLVFAAGLLPFSASAMSESELKRSAVHTYMEALEWAKCDTFQYYCGKCVAYQLFALGITTSSSEGNVSGCNAFDYFKDKSKSSGGYKIAAYPSSKYTLKQALNAISSDGTKEVHNILVGFDWFRSEKNPDLQDYGHVLLIHGIKDGKVYYVESYTQEGKCQVKTISDFCSYYKSSNWTFDGVIHFGTTRDKLIDDDTNIHSRTNPTSDSGTLKHPVDMAKGDSFTLKGLIYCRKKKLTKVTIAVYNSEGSKVMSKSVEPNRNYYNVGRIASKFDFTTLAKGTYSFVATATNEAGNTYRKQWDFNVGSVSTADDVITLTDELVPGTVLVGDTFAAGGTVKSTVTNLLTVTAAVFDGQGTKLTSATAHPYAKSYDLSKLNTSALLAELEPGSYIYKITGKNKKGTQTLLEEPFTVKNEQPGILQQPQNVDTTEGGSVTFTVTASGSGLTYQWQVLEAGSSTWKNSPATGNTTATLTVPATLSRNGYKYRCIVKSGSTSVTSSAATLTVTAEVKITAQPQSVNTTEGGNVTFRVTASGQNLTYQWQVCEAGKTAWKDSPATGNKTATLTVPATLSRSGYKYRCIVKSGSTSVTSSAATLTVTPGVKITAQPQSVSTKAGGSVTFAVTASGSNLTYQWQVCEAGKTAWKDSPADGNKTSTLIVPATASRNSYKYRCIVKSVNTQVISAAATLTVS